MNRRTGLVIALAGINAVLLAAVVAVLAVDGERLASRTADFARTVEASPTADPDQTAALGVVHRIGAPAGFTPDGEHTDTNDVWAEYDYGCPTDTCQIDPFPLLVAWDRQVGTGQIGANLDFCRLHDGCSVQYQRDGFTVNVGIMRSAVTKTLDYLLTVTVITS